MLFYSPIFLFVFMPCVFLFYFNVQGKHKDTVLLLASFTFYFWAEPRFVFVALGSAIIDYFLCLQIFNQLNTPKSKYYLAFGIVLNVFVLFYYKYMDFFIGNMNTLFAQFNYQPLPLLKIALPIGVSFIVFEKITYLVDVYRKKGPPAKSLREYLVYIFLFPKLLAGPIVKYHDISAQLIQRNQTLNDFFEGFKRFLMGLIKKVLLADTVAELANNVFALPIEQLGFTNAWLGIICFTLQIYFDFSAYSDMAIGIARMFGFKLLENFNMPYIAVNFTDFWRRWHISLSTWIKEYLYISLGGNRMSTLRTYINLWICFLISGLWHGASWNFVLWGAYNGFFLVFDKLFWLRFSSRLPNYVNAVLTLLFVMFGWVIFRSNSLAQIQGFFAALFHLTANNQYIYVTPNLWTAIFIGTLISLIPLTSIFDSLSKIWRSLRLALIVENWALCILSFFAISRVISATFNPFLYFRF